MIDHGNSDESHKTFRPELVSKSLFPTDHKAIGLSYLWLALFSVFLGVAMSVVMRAHLVWPSFPLLSGPASSPERYAAFTLLHGSLMVLMVLTAAPQAGFGNYLLPVQIGAQDMAFPGLNLLGFWLTVVSLFGIIGAFFLPPEGGFNLWICSVGIFCLAALTNGLNLSVTTIDLRTKGMTLPRLPVTVWAWFINAILSLLIFSILLAACVYLLADRLLGTRFFSVPFLSPSGSLNSSETMVLWQRLFWFFTQAQVYVAILPCFGIITHLIATLSRKALWAQRAVVLALCAVGLFGFCIWGQHTFASGLNPYSPLVFSLLASSLGLPASVLLISWFGTLWNGKAQLTTAMLFALGFVSLFLAGGLSGLFLARNDLAPSLASDDFVTGHFHLVMGIAATFAMLAALFFWFPKMFGRHLDERLGKFHFWITFSGVYCVFMPMHWLGLVPHLHLSPEATLTVASAGANAVRSLVTVATLVTVAAQGIFVVNFVATLLRCSEAMTENPWCATTLEWSLPSPPPLGNFAGAAPVVYRGAYEFGIDGGKKDFALQSVPTDSTLPPTTSGNNVGLQPSPST
jgi:cytochrome c oxidase subunit 1